MGSEKFVVNIAIVAIVFALQEYIRVFFARQAKKKIFKILSLDQPAYFNETQPPAKNASTTPKDYV